MDHGTIGDSWQDVLYDLHLLELEAAKIGLVLNLSKSEHICDDNHTLEAVLQEAPGLPTVSVSQAMFLGTPVGDSESAESTIKDKTEVLRLMGDRLSVS